MTDDIWLRPDPRLRRLRRLEIVIATLVVAPALGFAVGSINASVTAGVIGAVVVVVAAVVVTWFVQRRVAAWGYCSRADDLLVRRGVMIRRLSVVPYGRMQFVDVTAGPVERSFGLATVKMHTAAAASDARIPGLLQADAAVLRDRLAALGESRAAGL